MSIRWKLAAAVLVFFLAMPAACAQPRRERNPRSNAAFSYYLLALSYAPDFCAQAAGNRDPRECAPGRRMGFVVHGLWPQAESGRGPEDCTSTSPVSRDTVRLMLNYIPTESLIQHEWATHGSCTGLSAADYFALVRRARDMVKIPGELNAPAQQVQLSPGEIEARLAAANPSFPKAAFRVSCYRDSELQEVRLCLTKDLSPRGCSASAGRCAAGTVLIRPVR